jgi:outer membrane protein assembly factor BamB
VTWSSMPRFCRVPERRGRSCGNLEVMAGRRHLVAIAALLAAVLTAPAAAEAVSRSTAAANGAWTEAGFDAANTHFNPAETVLSTANVGELIGDWNDASAAGSAPAVVGDHVYAESSTAVNAFNRLTGAVEWSRPVAGSSLNSSVAVAGGVVYAAGDISSPSYLYAFDAATGAQHWKLKLPAFSGWPLVIANGVVYVGDGYRTLYAVAVATHTVKWKFRAQDGVGRPAIANGHVYVGSFDHHLYSLDEATGQRQWSANVGDEIFSAPSVANGIVYVGQRAGTLYALDASNGSRRWKFQTASIFTTDAAIANGTVYLGGHDDYVYAVNATTGKQRWKFKTGNVIVTNPVVANGVVYVSSNDKNLYALDAATGQNLLTFYTGVAALSNVVVSNGNVFAGFPTGHLRRFVLPR